MCLAASELHVHDRIRTARLNLAECQLSSREPAPWQTGGNVPPPPPPPLGRGVVRLPSAPGSLVVGMRLCRASPLTTDDARPRSVSACGCMPPVFVANTSTFPARGPALHKSAPGRLDMATPQQRAPSAQQKRAGPGSRGVFDARRSDAEQPLSNKVICKGLASGDCGTASQSIQRCSSFIAPRP